MKFPRLIRLPVMAAAVVLWATLLAPPHLHAAEPSVTATLSSTTTSVGEPVEFDIVIRGARGADVPNNIEVTGLSIIHSGQQTNIQMQNFNVTYEVTHGYTVLPNAAGKYTIPSVSVEVHGKKYATAPLTLSVNASVSGGNSNTNSALTAPLQNSRQGGNAQDNAPIQVATAELIIPKKQAYVGEAIPAEVRIYFDSRVRVQVGQAPGIKSDGFTVQKLTDPEQKQIEKDGRVYLLVTYKSAITPVKSGKLTLGPAELPFIAAVPIQRKMQRPQRGGPFDDPFFDNFFNNSFGGFEQREFNVKSDPIDLEVKPLPRTNQPKTFSGAVGTFAMETEASPLKVAAGDPITVKLKISGRGNFDRVSAPVMTDEQGWRNYPATGKFTADDDIGISGSKTFEMVVIPDEKKSELPAIEFSYFDPITEKYVVLNAERLPIMVSGASAPVARATPSPSNTPAPEIAKNPEDIHPILAGTADWDKSFSPVYRQPVFWGIQAIPLLGFLGLIGIQINRRRNRDLFARQLAGWRKEKGALMKTLQRGEIDATAFYDAAIRYARLEAAGTLQRSPETISASEAVSSRPLDPETRTRIEALFNAHEELRYAGYAATHQKVPDSQRQSVLETLTKFEAAHA